MTTPTLSNLPEETPTPSTVSLPSYQEWYDFFLPRLQGQYDEAVSQAEWLAAETIQFLAQRGSRQS